MKAYLLCPSQHLDACEVSREMVATIKSVGFEKVGVEREVKGVIYFHEFKKALVIGRTNHSRLISLFGDETDDWIDERVILYPAETLVDEGDRIVPCLRIKGVNGEVFRE